MKPIREWLNDLPEPYKQQAIENWEKYPTKRSNENAENNHRAMEHAFVWSKSIQGGDYWYAVYNWLLTDGRQLLPAPYTPSARNHALYTALTPHERAEYMGKLIIAVQNNESAYDLGLAAIEVADRAGVYERAGLHDDKGALSDLDARIENGITSQQTK